MSHDLVVLMRSLNLDFKNVRPKMSTFFADALHLPIVHSTETAKLHLDHQHDVIYLFEQSYFFCPFRSELLPLLSTAKRVVQIGIEYRFGLDARVKKFVTDVWSNIPSVEVTHINFNRFATYPTPLDPFFPRHEGLFYYGAIRPDRMKYVHRYFDTDLYPRIYSLNKKKIEDIEYIFLGKNVQLLPKLNSVYDLSHFQTTIYLEDVYTYSHYNSPAMRFYECLSMNVAQLFDESCIPTFKTAGYDITPFVVNSARDVSQMLPHWDEIRKRQYQLWMRDYPLELRQDLLREHVRIKKQIK